MSSTVILALLSDASSAVMSLHATACEHAWAPGVTSVCVCAYRWVIGGYRTSAGTHSQHRQLLHELPMCKCPHPADEAVRCDVTATCGQWLVPFERPLAEQRQFRFPGVRQQFEPNDKHRHCSVQSQKLLPQLASQLLPSQCDNSAIHLDL